MVNEQVISDGMETQTTAVAASPQSTETTTQLNVEELENTVREHQKKGLEAGRALSTIKNNKLYKQKGSTDGKLTWDKYCQGTFGFTPQYANRLASASDCHDKASEFFAQRKQEDRFSQLPETVDFWVKLSKMNDEDREKATLEKLFDDNGKLVGNWKDKLASDLNTVSQSKSVSSSGDKKELERLAQEVISTIRNQQEIVNQLSGLSNMDAKHLATALTEEFKTFRTTDKADTK